MTELESDYISYYYILTSYVFTHFDTNVTTCINLKINNTIINFSCILGISFILDELFLSAVNLIIFNFIIGGTPALLL